MFQENYFKLLEKYYGSADKKKIFVWFGLSGQLFGLFSDIFLALFLAAQRSQSGEIDSGISQAIRDSTKISMSKNIFSDSRIETTITAEEISFKRNTVDVWPD